MIWYHFGVQRIGLIGLDAYGHGDFHIIIIPLKGRALYRNIGKYSNFYPNIFWYYSLFKKDLKGAICCTPNLLKADNVFIEHLLLIISDLFSKSFDWFEA